MTNYSKKERGRGGEEVLKEIEWENKNDLLIRNLLNNLWSSTEEAD